jgi:hypothetical protein
LKLRPEVHNKLIQATAAALRIQEGKSSFTGREAKNAAADLRAFYFPGKHGKSETIENMIQAGLQHIRRNTVQTDEEFTEEVIEEIEEILEREELRIEGLEDFQGGGSRPRDFFEKAAAQARPEHNHGALGLGHIPSRPSDPDDEHIDGIPLSGLKVGGKKIGF